MSLHVQSRTVTLKEKCLNLAGRWKNILTGIIYTIKGTHHLNEETGKTGKDKHWAYKAGLCYLEYGQIVFRACILTKNVLWASILNLFDVDYWSKTSQILEKSITKTCRDTWYTITTRYTLVFLSCLVDDLSLFLWKMSWWERKILEMDLHVHHVHQVHQI